MSSNISVIIFKGIPTKKVTGPHKMLSSTGGPCVTKALQVIAPFNVITDKITPKVKKIIIPKPIPLNQYGQVFQFIGKIKSEC